MQLSGALVARAHIWNGTAWVKAPGDVANGLDVDVTRLPSLPAGANAIGSVIVTSAPSTAVTGPLTDAQLRATPVPVSGTFWQTTQPVSLATNAPDVTDRAAREAGRVRLWDGTDEATILPRGTVPTAADKGVCVVPLNVSRPAYQVVTAEITLATTVGVKECLNLWHPSSLTKDVFILEIGVNLGVPFTVGRMAYEISFTSAIGTGGATVTPQQLNRADPASGLEARVVKTGGGTLAGAIFQRATQAPASAANPNSTNYDGIVVYRAKDLDDYSDAILLRNGVAEGLNVQANVLTALTGAPIITVYARYVERA